MSRQEFTITEADDKEVKLAICKPEYEDFEESEKVYAIKISTLIRENAGRKLLSRHDLNKYLKESGAWTDEDTEIVRKIQEELNSLLGKIKKGGTKISEARKWAIEAMGKRRELLKVMSRKQSFDDVTLESFAENEKIDYLIYCSTVHAETGAKYWDSFEDMKNDKLSEAYQKGSRLVMQVVFGVDLDFDKKLPENKWLKKYGFINENLEYIDRKTGEKVDSSGRPLKELEKEIQEEQQNINGDILEEQPFVDDETNEPITVT